MRIWDSRRTIVRRRGVLGRGVHQYRVIRRLLVERDLGRERGIGCCRSLMEPERGIEVERFEGKAENLPSFSEEFNTGGRASGGG